MKKIVIAISILAVILISGFVVFFTPAGSNAVIKPIVNAKLKKQLKNHKVEVKRLDSKLGYIDIEAVIDNSINLKAYGDVSYLAKKFDIVYNLNAQKFEINSVDYPLNLDIKGQAVGKADNFGLNGRGKAFNSDINYKLIVKNNNPKSINAQINNAKLTQILMLTKLPPYIMGVASLNVNMPSLDIKNPSGSANLQIKEGKFNRKLIYKKTKIILPKNEKFVANLSSKVLKKYVVSRADLNTTTAKLKIKKITSTLDFKVSKGYFDLKINNLSRLNSLAKMKLRGKANFSGVFYANLKKDIIQANIKTKSFGGVAKIKYKNNFVKADLKDVSIDKILYTLTLPRYTKKALISGEIKIPDLKKLDGNFNIKSSGRLNKKFLKVKLPSYNYKIFTKGNISKGSLFAKKTTLLTSFVKLYLQDSKFNLLTKAFTSGFTVDVKNLKALSMFTNNSLQGAIKLNGNISAMGSKVSLKANSKSLGGNLKVNYKNNSLKAVFKNLNLTKVLYLLKQPNYLKKGFLVGHINLNSLNPINGIYDIKANGIVNSAVVKKLHNINLGRDLKYELKTKNGVIKNGIVKGDVKINSTLASINLSSLHYNINKSSLQTKYAISIDNLEKLKSLTGQELAGSLSVTGNLKSSKNYLFTSGVINKFDGTINYTLKNDNLSVNAAGLRVVKILAMLKQKKTLDGVAKGNLKYNLKSKKGNFKININEGKFLNSKLVAILKQYANFDLSKEIFNDVKINGVINQNIINFNLNTDSKKLKIKINNGKIDTKAQTIKSKVVITLHGNDYVFKVSGPLKDPHIKLSFSGVVKEKVKEKVFEKLQDKLKGKVNLLISKDDNNKSLEDSAKEKIDKKIDEKIKKVIPKEAKELFKNIF